MSRYVLVVFTNPVEGREDEYNDWYQNVHLGDVVAVKGFKSAQRFRLVKPLNDQKAYPYLAIYEIETDDIEAALDDMQSRANTPRMMLSPALSEDLYAVTYEPFGPKVEA